MTNRKICPVQKLREMADDTAFNQRCRANTNYPASHDRELWRAVLLQAIQDAYGELRNKQSRWEAPHAKAWLNGNSEDYQDVCAMANVKPETVYRPEIITPMLTAYSENARKRWRV